MGNQIVLLGGISFFIILQVIFWSRSLVLRESLKEDVIDIIRNSNTSKEEKKIALTYFILSGKYFVAFHFLFWVLCQRNVKSPTVNTNNKSPQIRGIQSKAISVNKELSPFVYVFSFFLMKLYFLYKGLTSHVSQSQVKSLVEKEIILYSDDYQMT